jgi:transmembrane sensor
VNDRILDITELLILQRERPLTEQEQSVLDQWLRDNPQNASVARQVQEENWIEKELGTFAHYNADKSRKILEARLARTKPVHRIHFLRIAWIRYAAAIIILFGIGAYLYINNQKGKPSVTQTNPVPLQNDVAPGGNRASLTLADGSKIVLDSAANGKIAQQGQASVEKSGSKIVYSPLQITNSRLPTAFNTMSTPRGGQYQLTLPDGSQVWLNAESSITYPTAFTGKERTVAITGEAYFEVVHNAHQPFMVQAGSQLIEVLGTKFNVSTYKDEPSYKTTLLEGKVKLSAHDARNAVHTSLILQPGQQGQLKDHQLSLAANPDVEQVMAWKDGVFNFNKVTLAEAMRQLSRWYDVEILYEGGKIPDRRFGGEMGRDLKLSQVLKGLQAIGLKFAIQGKTLTVKSS